MLGAGCSHVSRSGSKLDGPLRQPCASINSEWRSRSWDDMYWAEERSPVHRVMSMQSRDWLRRSRREERGLRRRGWVRFIARWRGGVWRSWRTRDYTAVLLASCSYDEIFFIKFRG